MEIKTAYREKIRWYHPDGTHGLGAELQALAEEKTKELNAPCAWAMLWDGRHDRNDHHSRPGTQQESIRVNGRHPEEPM